ncbi:MAG: TAXI family TRAP transporter solute-binding subunit [Gracilibacteraceae bacterium]|jgi:TRAP transporter TAXI family solute receptor|nr:TAXI family TRAP transporter solute-binding subunit [Gracilibacteraceae bacterium]
MRKFTKTASVAFMILGVLAILISGCAAPASPPAGSPPDQSPAADPAQAAQLRIMSTSGTDKYFLTTGICAISDESALPVKVSHQTVSGDLEAARRLRAGDADIGMINVYVACMSQAGTYVFEEEGSWPDIRGMFAGPANTMGQFIVRADSDVKTFDDVKNKCKIATLMGLSQLYTRTILESYGKVENTDYVLIASSYTDMVDQIKDKTVDMIQFWSSAPSTHGQNIEADVPLRLLPVNDETIEVIKEKIDPSVYATIVAAGTYRGTTEDVATPATPTIFVCRSDLSDEAAYNFTKLTLENLEALIAIHPLAAEIRPENQVRDLPFPLHPGAERYLQENGYLD